MTKSRLKDLDLLEQEPGTPTIIPDLIAEVRRLRETLEKIKDAKCDPNVKPGPEDMTKNELMFCELSGRIHCIAKEALEAKE